MNTLGIWDGHDAGAALLVDGRLVAAINEERFTRRKLDYVFPAQSIAGSLAIGGVGPNDIHVVAGSTLEVSKAMGRLMPASRERFYLTRRRRARPGAWSTPAHVTAPGARARADLVVAGDQPPRLSARCRLSGSGACARQHFRSPPLSCCRRRVCERVHVVRRRDD